MANIVILAQVRATQPPKNVGRTTKTESRTSISMIYRVNGFHKLWLCLVLLANSKRADSKRCWIYGSEFISSTLLAFYRKNVSCAPDPPSLVPVSLPLSRIVGLLSAVVAFTFEYCRVCVTLDAVLPARMNGSICVFQDRGGFDARIWLHFYAYSLDFVSHFYVQLIELEIGCAHLYRRLWMGFASNRMPRIGCSKWDTSYGMLQTRCSNWDASFCWWKLHVVILPGSSFCYPNLRQLSKHSPLSVSPMTLFG